MPRSNFPASPLYRKHELDLSRVCATPFSKLAFPYNSKAVTLIRSQLNQSVNLGSRYRTAAIAALAAFATLASCLIADNDGLSTTPQPRQHRHPLRSPSVQRFRGRHRLRCPDTSRLTPAWNARGATGRREDSWFAGRSTWPWFCASNAFRSRPGQVPARPLNVGGTVVADAVNSLTTIREAWRAVAASAASHIVEVEVVCSDISEHRRRVENRKADISGHTLPTWDEIQQREYEPWSSNRLVIDSAKVSAIDAASRIFNTLELSK